MGPYIPPHKHGKDQLKLCLPVLLIEQLFLNEVIVYRVLMYANPLLIIQAMYITTKGQSVYCSTRG